MNVVGRQAIGPLRACGIGSQGDRDKTRSGRQPKNTDSRRLPRSRDVMGKARDDESGGCSLQRGFGPMKTVNSAPIFAGN